MTACPHLDQPFNGELNETVIHDSAKRVYVGEFDSFDLPPSLLSMILWCPNCHTSTNTEVDLSETIVVCPHCDSKISLVEMLSRAPELSIDTELAGEFRDEPADLAVGTTVGHFKIQKLLGKGGFGVVYQAHDLELDRFVAIKLPRISSLSLRQTEIFVREAQAAAQLQHPNIVSVYGIGQVENLTFIVSEFIDGMTLKTWRLIEQRSPSQVATMVGKIARALQSAHAAGIVHRDIKPGNVLVDFQFEPHITDFGLAERNNNQPSLFQSGKAIGTAAYMSPEQRIGKKDQVDHRTDIYSLGVVLYELLVGKRPTTEDKQLPPESNFVPPNKIDPQLPDELSAICMKAIAQDASDRFQNCDEFASELDRFNQGLPIATLPLTRVQSLFRRFKRNRRSVALASIGFILGAILIGLYLLNLKNPSQDEKDQKALSNTNSPKISQTDEPDTDSQPTPTKTAEDPDAIRPITVRFNVSEPKCSVRIVRVDSENFRIDYENIIELQPLTTSHTGRYFQTTLNTGWHIIEVISEDGRIAEVWRRVPETPDEQPDARYRSTNWTPVNDEKIKLFPIRVEPVDEVEYIRCEGGSFFSDSAANGNIIRAAALTEIKSFLIAPTEVSLKEFVSVMGELPNEFDERDIDLDTHGDLAACNVAFLEALEYAEKVGGRLPTFEEYLFAATNRGNTKYPWGDGWIFEDWKLGKVGFPVEDKSDLGIKNLYSNVSEWTCEVTVPPWWANNRPQMKIETLQSMRGVVGGTHAFHAPVTELKEIKQSPKVYLVHPTDLSRPNPVGLGFRVYRSLTPRLDKESEAIQYYLRNEDVLTQSRTPRKENN